MNPPTIGYLASILGPFAPEVPAASYAPDPGALSSQAPPMPDVVPPPPAAAPAPTPTPGVSTEPLMSVPPPGPAVVEAPPPAPGAPILGAPAPQPMDPPVPTAPAPAPNVGATDSPMPAPSPPGGFDLTSVSGGGAPARELDLSGPKMHAALDQRNQGFESAIGTMAEREEAGAQAEYAQALSQEREAMVRQAAIEQSNAERQEEFEQRQADFDTTTREMAKLGTIDRNRFYNSRSTAGKIAAFAEMMLAGFRGSESLIRKEIDADVKAQEFAYLAARDQVTARQTAFAMAMQKYQNIDAARAVARAAAIDVTTAQLSQLAAKHHGTQAANHATAAIANLGDEKLKQFQQFYRFMPATGPARYWRSPEGLIMNESQALAYAKELRERQFDREKQVVGIGGQMMLQQAKEGAEGKTGERQVVLDGKDALAVNKQAAEKWNEYNHGRAVFALALNKLKEARDRGDVGAYDAARAQLIEEYPKLLGYTRAPTEGQISHTVGPNAIPEYNHWFNHAKYGPVGAATYARDQGRGSEKIKFLEETLATSDKAMRQNTFGAEAATPKMPGTFSKEYAK